MKHLVFLPAAIFTVYFLVVGPYMQAALANLIWGGTRIGEHRIECRQSALKLLGIQITNLLLMVLTLGLFYPWALVRMARFRIEALSVLAMTDLAEFEASADRPVGAIGEETASVLDLDISL